MAKIINLNFHQSFKPERQYIGSILNVANMIEPMSVKDISALTGIPNGVSSGKVEPHIAYAEYMGFINAEKKDGLYSLKRTHLGDIVNTEDPGLQEKLSILLCHAMMLREKAGASMWSVIFKKILPSYRMGAKKEVIMEELDRIFTGKVTPRNFGPFMSSYEGMFSELDVLSLEKNIIKTNLVQYNKEYIYLYALVLLEYWDELFPQQDEISAVQFSEMKFGKAFGWDELYEYEVLEHLVDRGFIRLNKQLVPYTILRLVDKYSVEEYLYSELC